MLVVTVVLLAAVARAQDGCEWRREAEDSRVSVVLACRLRTISGTRGLLADMTPAQLERVTALRLECSDVLFFESSLEAGFLAPARRLRDLRLEHCKIRRVPRLVLSSLRELRHLSLRTHNTEWSAMTMDFDPESFRGLAELRSLDLADNNIWSLPAELFCPLYGLASLDLSRNRLRDVAELGFSDWGQGPAAPGKTCNGALETLDLSANGIAAVPDNALTSLRSLRRLLMQDNAIASLADRALVGLSSLQVLNASSNRLVALPPELFQSCREVKEVYLQNNSISVLAPGLLEGLDQLLVLDLSGNQLTSNWVNRDTFSGLVRLVVLNLSSNSIARVDAHVFRDLYSLQVLNLERNGLEVIADGAFAALSNLHALTLSHNSLASLEPHHLAGLYVLNQLFVDGNHLSVVHPRAFENCTNLQDLGLSGNLLEEVPEGLGRLRHLKTLDLGDNLVSEVRGAALEGLDQLYGLRLIGNRIVNVTRDAFAALPSLQVLNLAANRVSRVDPGAFGTAPSLRALRLDGNRLADLGGALADLSGLVWLNVSDNQLQWLDLARLPASLEWLDMHRNLVSELAGRRAPHLRVKTLDASFNRLTELAESSLPDSVESVFLNDNFIAAVRADAFFGRPNLTRVVLYANQLQTMDLVALRLAPVPEDRELPQFYIGGNPFHCDCAMEWLLRAGQLGQSRQHPRLADLDSVTCTLSYPVDSPPRPLLDLSPQQLLCPYEAHCFALCHCCDFDACDCEMTCPAGCRCFHDHAWSANVVDCSRAGLTRVPPRIPMDATEIRLDGNDLGELGSHVFIGKKKLRALFLNGSNVAAIHNRTFNGATSLQVLHLEDNQLEELRGFEFEQLDRLSELYLDRNDIARVGNTTFQGMRALEVLSLDGNRMREFAPWRQLPADGARVSLRGNSWACDCAWAARMEEWLRRGGAPQDVSCAGGQTLVQVAARCRERASATAVRASAPRAPGYLPLLGACLAAGALALLAGLAYLFRRPLRLWAHARCGVRVFEGDAEDRDRLYDAYLICGARDRDPIGLAVACALEQAGFAVCLHHRDAPSGPAYLPESVLGAADASRRLLLVLSPAFLRGEWSRPELRAAVRAAVARRRPRRLVLLLTAAPAQLPLDADLRPLLGAAAVVRWGERRFWEKLRFAMPDPPRPPAKAGPSPLDAWHRYAATPTPTQSTYVSENSSQRTTDHEEDEDEAYARARGYVSVDGALKPHHVYSTIPDQGAAPPRGRTYFV
ncbi:toll-like receptor 6 [Bacillus rossius redtenbacheri]|uniref:toll-like receptor 6 n=1 Tax=Bacillus rossius redtenbacheri TaxID=93214 RepID=UPI002FDDB588